MSIKIIIPLAAILLSAKGYGNVPNLNRIDVSYGNQEDGGHGKLGSFRFKYSQPITESVDAIYRYNLLERYNQIEVHSIGLRLSGNLISNSKQYISAHYSYKTEETEYADSVNGTSIKLGTIHSINKYLNVGFYGEHSDYEKIYENDQFDTATVFAVNGEYIINKLLSIRVEITNRSEVSIGTGFDF